VRAAFNMVFATLVMRIAYGPAFVTPASSLTRTSVAGWSKPGFIG